MLYFLLKLKMVKSKNNFTVRSDKKLLEELSFLINKRKAR